MSTHNLCFEQKYEKYHNFYLEIFPFLVVKFLIYLNRRVFVMINYFVKQIHKIYNFGKNVCNKVFKIFSHLPYIVYETVLWTS